MFALSSLHSIVSDVFKVYNVCHNFIYNGKVDAKTNSAPCFKNLVSIFRGDAEETILKERSELMDRYFEEMYLLGDNFDQYKGPKDTASNSKGNIVKRTKNEISLDNQHRSKVQSSSVQANANGSQMIPSICKTI